MKFSNRFLWFLIILCFMLFFYGFYKYFFELKLTSFNINSNVENFSWSLINSKFKKEFFCEKSNCIIKNIPPFEYELMIKKNNYINYKENIDIWKKNKLKIYLKKDILFDKIKDSSFEKSNWYKVNDIFYEKVYNSSKNYYKQLKNKLYIYNKNTSQFTEIIFIPKIYYIKSIWNNNLIISSKVWAYNFNLNNNKLEYFSLFWDYTISHGNYIWVINNLDKARKNNFWFSKLSWDLIIFYDKQNKTNYLLKQLKNKVSKIYNISDKIYLETKDWKIFLLK